jgi:hypothetical protein
MSGKSFQKDTLVTYFVFNDRFVQKRIAKNLLSRKRQEYCLEENGANQTDVAVGLLQWKGAEQS